MSKNVPFKPELIDILRIADDNDPNNKDVAYNRGHLETQLTFYIGKVNFYCTVDNINKCYETNTGDSSSKIPYIPHTFTKRDNILFTVAMPNPVLLEIFLAESFLSLKQQSINTE